MRGGTGQPAVTADSTIHSALSLGVASGKEMSGAYTCIIFALPTSVVSLMCKRCTTSVHDQNIIPLRVHKYYTPPTCRSVHVECVKHSSDVIPLQPATVGSHCLAGEHVKSWKGRPV